MARIVVQDCLERIPNRFVLVMLAAKRMFQLQHGSDPLLSCKNKEAVTALREIAAGKVGLRNVENMPGLSQQIKAQKRHQASLEARFGSLKETSDEE